MLFLGAAIAGLVLVLLLRPAQPRPIPARVVPGDEVSTTDGVYGVVERIDGPLALVRSGASGWWVLAARLLQGADDHHRQTTSEASAASPVFPRPPIDSISDGGWLTRFGRAVYDTRKIIVVGWIIIAALCIPLSGTLERHLSAGGFTPRGEAQSVVNDMLDVYGLPVARLEVIVPGTPAAARQRVNNNLALLQRVPLVAGYTNFRPSVDGTQTAFTVTFTIQDEYVVDSLPELRGALATAGFAASKIQLAGTPAHYEDIGTQTKQDLIKAERIGIPLALIVLLIVFGTAVAAAMPLIVGLVAVITTLAVLHILTLPLHLSIYVMNIASLLGLGLGIDYSLLGVARFREELDRGHDVRTATATTVAVAGRAAAISGVAVLLGMTALAAIPLKVMTSMAIAGVVVVMVSVAATLTLLPALLAIAGPSIERLPIRRRKSGTPEQSRWYRLMHQVMRRPGRAIVLALFILGVIAAPARHVVLGVPHNEVLPTHTPARIAAATLSTAFKEEVVAPIVVDVASAQSAVVATAKTQLAAMPGAASVRLLPMPNRAGHTLILVDPKHGKLGGAASRSLAHHIRAHLKIPATFRLSGQGPGEIEFLSTIAHGVPTVLMLVFISTFVVLLFAFRSAALPAKAILLDTLSIVASLGAVVAVFQLGRGAHLLGTQAMGYTEATIPIVLFCILFGLSMDYEVFMLARITELYQQGHSNSEATARGVAGTAPLITGAALILIVLGLSFATSQIVLVKEIGFGLAVALALDATCVRFMLLPAAMQLLGSANWWLPAHLLRRIPRISWAH